jgi:hypothetical protein
MIQNINKNTTITADQLAQGHEENVTKSSAMMQINPAKPDGLVQPPKDFQYEVPVQMRHPLNFENRGDKDDIKTLYNPHKKATIHNNYV